jgi:hypothetical protein
LQEHRGQCEHHWVVSVYAFFRETASKSEPGPTIAKDFATYQTSRQQFDVTQADAGAADGLRAVELMCAVCGHQRRIQWPQVRTEIAFESGVPRVEPA